MDLQPGQVAMLRSIKKTAVLVLLMQLVGRPLSVVEIASTLAISRNTALGWLRELSPLVVTQTCAGWLLIEGSQLNLPFMSEGAQNLRAQNPREDPAPAAAPERKSSLPSNGSSSSRRRGAQKSRGGQGTPAELQDRLKALGEYGIGESANVMKLVALDWCTPEYIHAQAERLDNEKRFTTALLITAIRCHDPMPMSREQRDERNRQRSYKKFVH